MSSGRIRMTMAALLCAMVLACSTLIMTPPHVRPSGEKKSTSDRKSEQDILTADEDPKGNAAKDYDRSLATEKPIDLTLYVVFHKQLHDKLYAELNVPLLPAPKGEAKKVFRPNSVLADGTEVVFLATNPNITKQYNLSNPLYDGRVVHEWELPGYSQVIGAKLNEYGAMGSVFASNWSAPAARAPQHASGPLPEEWIGFLQYDMRIDSGLVQRLRRRIAQKGIPPNAKISTDRRKSKNKSSRCCVFSGVVYPAHYLLYNAMGQLILDEYNNHFGTSHQLTELPSMAILDMFIVPASEFNRMMPFLSNLMTALATKRKRFPDPSVPVTALSPSNHSKIEGADGTPMKWRRAKALEVMEGALAIALAFSKDLRHIQIPMRHDKIVDENDDEI